MYPRRTHFFLEAFADLRPNHTVTWWSIWNKIPPTSCDWGAVYFSVRNRMRMSIHKKGCYTPFLVTLASDAEVVTWSLSAWKSTPVILYTYKSKTVYS
jgi:hypothetical protein